MTCRWHIVVPAVAAAATGAAALILGATLRPTPRSELLINYLMAAAVLGTLTALIVWAVEEIRDGQDAIRAEIRNATALVHAEVRAGNAYDDLMASIHRDPPSGRTHLRSVKPS